MNFNEKLSQEVQVALQAEQFRILTSQVPILYAVLAINTAILSLSIFGSVSTRLSQTIPGTFAILIIIRALVWIYRKRSNPTVESIDVLLRNTTIIAAIVSLALGLWGVALLHSAVSDKPFVPLFIGFGAIACAYCLASLPRAAFATIFLAVTPVIFSLFFSGVKLQQATGLNLLLIFLLILRLIKHQYHYLIENIESRLSVTALAYKDPLTGLPNRRSFIDKLQTELNLTCSVHNSAIVAMIDLDGFKAINDTYGHSAGDGVLVQAAGRIVSACPPGTTVARLGGDEFAVLFNGADALNAQYVAIAIVELLNDPFVIAGLHIRLAASVGLATNHEENFLPTTLMAQADMALYEVKHSTGNSVQSFAPEMAARLHRRISIEQALLETSPYPKIDVVYQPIFDAKSMQLTAFEALARWHHPRLGSINPLEFMGIAERTGSISALSAQIFDTAIAAASLWPSHINLSVNLSAVELSQPGTPLLIMSLCNRHKFNPKRLEVEVTETSVLADFDIARQQLDSLRNVGIQVALDDFGSGYASISYLKEITFDRVKIDGELITDIIHSPKARRLLQGILSLCSAIGLPATAEKVECKRQMAILVGLGCHRLQGYLLSPPLSATAALRLAEDVRKVA